MTFKLQMAVLWLMYGKLGGSLIPPLHLAGRGSGPSGWPFTRTVIEVTLSLPLLSLSFGLLGEVGTVKRALSRPADAILFRALC